MFQHEDEDYVEQISVLAGELGESQSLVDLLEDILEAFRNILLNQVSVIGAFRSRLDTVPPAGAYNILSPLLLRSSPLSSSLTLVSSLLFSYARLLTLPYTSTVFIAIHLLCVCV